ncbi:P-loop NTPase [Gracilimonas mengyeensis]|uniref:MinD-like ATPase involved in chromosome partitioning or flagellar assembly n=1 Tax=Gracilimonas mengyeensis TaxID=1302730 RepID=A0A521FHT7_9BACT|nr:P-loop NTPase [Gracilimonas mengyeensis]SMO95686.1 MinD-like ATPase involved in chromosome partitioning or flagellar assembly [Gracilimonas mengyeensis]
MITQQNMNKPFVYTVISGKGGVGKSMASINTAAMLSKMGYKTALLDVDLGLANCATLMNEPVRATVTDWINGQCVLEELPQDASGISLVTAANEPAQANLSSELIMDALDQVVHFLKEYHDFVVIDTPAGAGEMALWALDTADIGTLILVDEPAAISDVYRLCKYVYNIDPEYRFASIINFADDEATAESTLNRFNTILSYFLQKKSHYLGFIPASKSVKDAVIQQTTLIESEAESEVLQELEFIANNLIALAANHEQSQLKPVL